MRMREKIVFRRLASGNNDLKRNRNEVHDGGRSKYRERGDDFRAGEKKEDWEKWMIDTEMRNAPAFIYIYLSFLSAREILGSWASFS